jgi:membrane protein HdeD
VTLRAQGQGNPVTSSAPRSARGGRSSAGTAVAGLLLVATGLAVLVHVVLAEVVVLVLLGVAGALSGLVLLVASMRLLPQPVGRSGVAGGALLIVVGTVLLRHPLLALGTVTLVAGASFLVAGAARLVAGEGAGRVLLPAVLTLAFGFVLLVELLGSSRELLGGVLGVQLLGEGAVLLASRSAARPS